MIIKFNPNLFRSTDKNTCKATFDFIRSFHNNEFIWDETNLHNCFLDEDGKFIENGYFTGAWRQEAMDRYSEILQMSNYITALHKKYLTTVSIGEEENEIKLADAIDLIRKPSIIVVENATNDGNFIKGIIKNYEKFKKRKSIFQLVHRAFEEKRLQTMHAGGAGGIKDAILRSTIKLNIIRFKVIALFDSDRENLTSINHKYRNLLNFLKGRDFNINDRSEWVFKEEDNYYWHMLYKRELENYLPLRILFENYDEVNEAHKKELVELDESALDFYKFEEILDDGYKSSLPKLFCQQGIASELEERCSHHLIQIELPNGTLESVSELENLLLMFAKII